MNNDGKKPWWRDGVIVFTKVSAYIAIPVIAASYIGKYLDKKYDTDPFIFLVLVAISFIFTIYLIWKEMKKFQKKIAIEEKKK
jgi:F0F1-type ATP synthase assembly protein I